MKRIISLLLSILVVLCMCPSFFAVSQNILILGDVSLDSKINVRDATLIQKYVAKIIKFTDENYLCADCNDDSRTNIKDATLIQKFVAKIDCPYPIGEELTFGDSTVDTKPVEQPTEPETETTNVTENSTTDPVESSVAESTTSQATTSADIDTPTTTIPATTVDLTDPSEQTTFSKPIESEANTSTVAVTEETLTTEIITEIITMPAYNPVKPDTNITIYFSNNVGWGTVYAYLYNEERQLELKEWPGTAMTYETTNEMGEQILKLDVDVSKYNRVVFTNGKSQTLNAALTVASSGFFITSKTPKTAMQLGLYSYGSTDYGKKETVKLSYPAGYSKPIEIWTPAGYNPKDTDKKYSVIYLLDGQNQFDDSDAYNGGWGSDEIVTALMKNGGDGYILVGIDNSYNRDSELTPDIGDVIPAYASQGFENGTGAEFAKFVGETVVPYIESNYNVYTDAAHSAVIGSSSGGIEAFYIGMEYMNEFGRIGALSPAFMLFDDNTWKAYFDKFDFESINNQPRIYFYNGGGDALEQELLPAAQGMQELLADLGYDNSRMTFVYDEKNKHNEAAWRNIMPEVITWLFELQ